MIVLLAPTKKQVRRPSEMGSSLLFADKANVIYQMLKSETKEAIQARFKISDKLANAVYNDYQN